MKKRTIQIAVGLFALGLGLGTESAAAATKWVKAQSAEVMVITDGGERDAAEFAVGYTAFRQALREFFKPTANLPPTTILLFRRQEQMEPYLPVNKERGTQFVSFTTEVDGEGLVAISLSNDRVRALELTYEFETSWTLRRLGYLMPLWMGQGTGEVFASLQWYKGKSTIGGGPDEIANAWRHGSPLPWKRFFELGYGSAEYNGREADGMAQAQSWALMHRILLDDERGRERFDELATKLRGQGGMEAVESLLGVPMKDLARDIEKHFSRRKFRREFPFDEAGVRASLKTGAVDDAELRIHLADLLVSANKQDEAEVEFARARAAAPDSALVKEWLARRELRRNNREDAARLYREAIAAGSHDSFAYLVSASQRMNDSRSSAIDRAGGGGRDLDESIEEIRQSLRLNPGSSEAYDQLGRAFFLSPTPTEENVAELSRGIGPTAAGVGIQLYRATLYERLGRNAQAVADLRQVAVSPAANNFNREFAQRRLDEVLFGPLQKEVEKLAKEKHYAEAHAAISRARGSDAAGDDAYSGLNAWVIQNEAWENVRTLYAEKKWAECRDAAQAFIKAYPDTRVAATAKEMASESARMLDRHE